MSNIAPITNASATNTNNTLKTTASNDDFENKPVSYNNNGGSNPVNYSYSLDRDTFVSSKPKTEKQSFLNKISLNFKGNKPNDYDEEARIKEAGNKALEESRVILEESKTVYDDVLETIDEVRSLIDERKENGFNDVKDENGNVIRKFIVDDTVCIMEELDDTGNVLRRAESDKDNSYLSIREYTDSKGNKYVLQAYPLSHVAREYTGDSEDKKYDEIEVKFYGQEPAYVISKKGVEETADGNKKEAKYFYFNSYNGKLEHYEEGRKTRADGSLEFAKVFTFIHDKLYHYENGCERLTDRNNSITEDFYFNKNGNMNWYFENIEGHTDDAVKKYIKTFTDNDNNNELI